MKKIYFLSSFCMVVALAVLLGCEADTPNSIERNVNFNVAGVYTRPGGGGLAERQTGARVTQFNIIQTGASLQAIDNNSIVFSGSIGALVDGNGTLTLNGRTTAGDSVTISGQIFKEGTEATITATWIEPSLTSFFYAKATVQPDPVSTSTNNAAVDCDQSKYQGCCSSHGGIRLDANGCVMFTSSGQVLCTDGQPSPTCSRR